MKQHQTFVPPEYRAPYPGGKLLDVVKGLPEGRGVSVYEAMVWNVVARLKAGTTTVIEYIVTETPPGGGKPFRVWGPGTEQDAIAWAQVQARMYVTLKTGGGLPQ